MKLSSPDDDSGGRVDQAVDSGTEAPSLPVVENQMTERLSLPALPLDDLAKLQGDILDDEITRIRELEDRADELKEQNEELRATVDKLSGVVRLMTVESEWADASCDACGGELNEKGGSLSEKRIECESCGDVIRRKP